MPEKVFAIPPTGSMVRGEPDYQDYGHTLQIYLDGVLATGENVGLYVQRYNLPEGWVEGRPQTSLGGPDLDRLERRYGDLRVVMAD